jgi:hypothetical protein
VKIQAQTWTSDQRYDDTGSVYLFLCSSTQAGISATTVSYRRFAGDVTFFSENAVRSWFQSGGTTTVTSQWAWNSSSKMVVGSRSSFGSNYTFDVSFVDGTRLYQAKPTLPISPFNVTTGGEPVCTQQTSPLGTKQVCTTYRYQRTGISGQASGSIEGS